MSHIARLSLWPWTLYTHQQEVKLNFQFAYKFQISMRICENVFKCRVLANQKIRIRCQN